MADMLAGCFQVDLTGGYYDAGDNVKFGLPMAFTVTMLSWSAMEFADDIAAAGEWRHVLEAIKWGTDYFVKAHTEPYVLWAEVGDGDTDHYCWQRPEDMTTSRQAYKVDRDNPGSDLVGETAAALAAVALASRMAASTAGGRLYGAGLPPRPDMAAPPMAQSGMRSLPRPRPPPPRTSESQTPAAISLAGSPSLWRRGR